MQRESVHCELLGEGMVGCLLCPHYCLLKKTEVGRCGVRQNQNGRLYSLVYGEVSSIALDPIEKKPLYHFYPGSSILSLGTKGCNLKCLWCQNWSISQDLNSRTKLMMPEDVITKAKDLSAIGIAYTYNEPFIWYEFVSDTAKLARSQGLKNVLVTNGYVNPKPLEEMIGLIDAMNIDIKSMKESFYRKYCQAELAPVLHTAKFSVLRCHVEITNLIIPTLNDKDEDFEGLTDWISAELGKNTSLHFSRYFPAYKMNIPFTSIETLKKAESIAKKKLKYVYLGNI